MYAAADEVEEPAGIPADVTWRIERYVALGLDAYRAVTLAERRDPTTGWFVDWRRFEALVVAGATPGQAFEILA